MRSEPPFAFERGIAHLRRGDLPAAESCLREALRERPDLAAAQTALGAILGGSGRHAEAEECLRAALALRPDAADAHGNLGNLLRQTGRSEAAAASLREALRLRPDYPEAHNNLGAVLHAGGQPAAAEAHFRAALRARPDYVEAQANLGALLRGLGRLDAALECLDAAVRLQPGFAEAQAMLGAVLRDLDRPAEAEAPLRAALALRPDLPAAATDLGSVLCELDRPEAALAVFDGALRTAPAHAPALLGRGIALGLLGRFAAAEASLRGALAIDPELTEALNALGDTLRNLGRLDAAEAVLRQALRQRPDYPEAAAGLGMVLLQSGQYAEGWAANENRLRARPWTAHARGFVQPQWRGEALCGQRLLIHAEQGLGDTLQFCRYVPLLPRDGEVTLEVPAALVRLLEGLPGAARVVPRGASLPQFDRHCPLLSLPHFFGTTLATVPAAVPYLAADPVRVAGWRERLAELPPGLRVGLVWAGNPAMTADRRRSIPLAGLAPLGAVPGVTLIGLQKGPAAAEPRPAGLRLHDAAPALHDFADTAALVMALDLVVAVDTAVVHLAGALGRPVWLLNRFDTCWRWLADRADSPWYPTLRQFRQTEPGAWPAVVERVALALAEAVVSGGPRSG